MGNVATSPGNPPPTVTPVPTAVTDPIPDPNPISHTDANGFAPNIHQGSTGTIPYRLKFIAKVVPPHKESNPNCRTDLPDRTTDDFKGTLPVLTTDLSQNGEVPWEHPFSSETSACGESGIICDTWVLDENGQYKMVSYPYVRIIVHYCDKKGSCYQNDPPLVVDCSDPDFAIARVTYPICLKSVGANGELSDLENVRCPGKIRVPYSD